jgi:hypothetical protein
MTRAPGRGRHSTSVIASPICAIYRGCHFGPRRRASSRVPRLTLLALCVGGWCTSDLGAIARVGSLLRLVGHPGRRILRGIINRLRHGTAGQERGGSHSDEQCLDHFDYSFP